MTAPLAFVDTETTGLDPHQHEIWEVALILRTDTNLGDWQEEEHLWRLHPQHLHTADPMALSISRYYERRQDPPPTNPIDFAHEFSALTSGAHLVGAVISFDALRLDALLRQYAHAPAWHYHLIDVEALAAGWCAAHPEFYDRKDPRNWPTTLPWSSDKLSRAVGVDPDQYERHSAMGDARWARDIYDAVMT